MPESPSTISGKPKTASELARNTSAVINRILYSQGGPIIFGLDVIIDREMKTGEVRDILRCCTEGRCFCDETDDGHKFKCPICRGLDILKKLS